MWQSSPVCSQTPCVRARFRWESAWRRQRAEPRVRSDAAAFWLRSRSSSGLLSISRCLAPWLGGSARFLTESFGRYWALGMAVFSLVAAVVAFWGPRVNVQRLADLRRPGISGAFVYGFIFSLGTSAAPLLVLLTVSAAQARPEYGLLLALSFGVGRGLPFLLVGLFAGLIMRFASLARWRRPLQMVSGFALLTVAVYYVRAFATLL